MLFRCVSLISLIMFSITQSVLVVIDIQGKLAYLMHEHEKLFKQVQSLLKASHVLGIPVILTEQVPEKIGATVPEISKSLHEHHHIIKKSFSCCGEPRFLSTLAHLNRQQIIVCGIEAHVCVIQTVADLRRRDYEVQVVVDALSARTRESKELALDRMKESGATLTMTEMLITELLRTSEHPKFKEILQLIK